MDIINFIKFLKCDYSANIGIKYNQWNNIIDLFLQNDIQTLNIYKSFINNENIINFPNITDLQNIINIINNKSNNIEPKNFLFCKYMWNYIYNNNIILI